MVPLPCFCGYSLAGSDKEGLCPECGKPCAMALAGTRQRTLRCLRTIIASQLLWLLGVVAISVIVYAMYGGGFIVPVPAWLTFDVILVFASIVLGSACMAAASVVIRVQPNSWAGYAVLVCGASVLMLYGLLTTQSVPFYVRALVSAVQFAGIIGFHAASLQVMRWLPSRTAAHFHGVAFVSVGAMLAWIACGLLEISSASLRQWFFCFCVWSLGVAGLASIVTIWSCWIFRRRIIV